MKQSGAPTKVTLYGSVAGPHIGGRFSLGGGTGGRVVLTPAELNDLVERTYDRYALLLAE